jgi:hypothetical protein
MRPPLFLPKRWIYPLTDKPPTPLEFALPLRSAERSACRVEAMESVGVTNGTESMNANTADAREPPSWLCWKGETMPKCNQCKYEGGPDTFDPSMSLYHDLKCPKCGTTNVDTEDMGEDYGYGKSNFPTFLNELNPDDPR